MTSRALVFRGTWYNTGTYTAGDVVAVAGTLYLCTAGTNVTVSGTSPDADTANWTQFSGESGGGGGGHPSTLYDATTDVAALHVDDGVIHITDEYDFHSHGILFNEGITANGGAQPTWADPTSTTPTEKGNFGFFYGGPFDVEAFDFWLAYGADPGMTMQMSPDRNTLNLFTKTGQTERILQVWDENGDPTGFWIPAGPISDSIYLYSDSPALSGLTSATPTAIPFAHSDADPSGDTTVDDGMGGFTAPAGARIIYHSDTFEFEFLADGYAQAQVTAYPNPRADGVFYMLIGSPAFLDANDTPTFLFAGSSVPLDATTSPPNAQFVLFAGGSTLRVPVSAGERWQVLGDMEAASGTTDVVFADCKIYWSAT